MVFEPKVSLNQQTKDNKDKDNKDKDNKDKDNKDKDNKDKDKDEKIKYLEEKLVRKNEVVSELMEQLIKAKKEVGVI